jgi:hypothetical protein
LFEVFPCTREEVEEVEDDPVDPLDPFRRFEALLRGLVCTAFVFIAVVTLGNTAAAEGVKTP